MESIGTPIDKIDVNYDKEFKVNNMEQPIFSSEQNINEDKVTFTQLAEKMHRLYTLLDKYTQLRVIVADWGSDNELEINLGLIVDTNLMEELNISVPYVEFPVFPQSTQEALKDILLDNIEHNIMALWQQIHVLTTCATNLISQVKDNKPINTPPRHSNNKEINLDSMINKLKEYYINNPADVKMPLDTTGQVERYLSDSLIG